MTILAIIIGAAFILSALTRYPERRRRDVDLYWPNDLDVDEEVKVKKEAA